jgi:glycosyltransferase involved in cell wall biosynthesis
MDRQPMDRGFDSPRLHQRGGIHMPQRIVLLSAFLSPFRSGAEAMVEEVTVRLADRFDVTIVTARFSRNLPNTSTLPPPSPAGNVDGTERGVGGVRIMRLGIGHPIDKYLFPFLAPFAARRLRPDIVHAVLESYAGLALVFCRWMVPQARRILTCQSTNTRLLVGWMHRSAHAITVISRVLAQRAQAFGRESVLIPNGIDRAAVERACGSHAKVPGRILFVGRLERMKGVDTLLTAFAAMDNGQWTMDNERRITTKLRIVGDGSQRATLEKLAHDLGIADRVTFAGWVKVPEVFDEFAQAEIFCGLSRSEALGNVFLEAQAALCAVIGTRVGGIPDSVEDGVTGLLVPPDDAKAAADALRRLIDDSTIRERLARAGKEHARGYDWDSIAERYSDVYRSAQSR